MNVFPSALILAVVMLSQAARNPNVGAYFEVATVRPVPTKEERRSVGIDGGPGTADPTTVRFLNMTLANLLSFAFDRDNGQVSGPGWIGELRYDIVAKVPNGTSREQFRIMLQNLLTERFQLSVHKEQKTRKVYALVVDKNGPKFSKPNHSIEDPPKWTDGVDKEGFPLIRPGETSLVMRHDLARLQGHDEPIAWLVRMLSGQTEHLVVDETGLTEKYDYTMRWVPERLTAENDPVESATPRGQNLFSALRDQLGLKLVSKSVPVEIIIVDRAERVPTAN